MAKRKPLFSLLLLLFFFIFLSLTHAADTDILRKLSKSLSPTPSGWSGPDPCKWSGIKCDSSSLVTSIDLSSQSLSGSLPPDLNQLSSLKTLSFQKNQLSGAIPSFSKLTNLEDIYLDTNNFTSVSPSAFYDLNSLQTLSLTDNINLEPWVVPDLSQSSSLVTLYASNVNLIGSIPDFLGSLTSLQNLRLSYNNLTGPLPSSFAGSGISNLWINNQVMGLNGPIDVLGKMTQLSQAWLHKNLFTGPIPDLSNCTSLFDLQLRDNTLTGIVPPSLNSLPKLANVSLANNQLQGPVPDLKNVAKVEIGNTNNFCNPTPGPCAPQVTTLLNIAGALGYPIKLADSWQGNDPCKDWTFITCDPQGKNITVINFAKQGFVGTISPSFADLGSLRNLFLNDNKLTGRIPDKLTSLPDLQTIDVSNNNLVGKVPTFSSKVTLKSGGNPLLGTDPPPGTDVPGTGPGSVPSTGDQVHNSSSVSAGMIAGVVIAVLVFLGVVFVVFYKCYYTKKRRYPSFGRVPTAPQNGKEMMNNGTVGGANGYGAAVNDLQSQSSGEHSEARFFEGGNIAISIEVIRQVTENFSEKNILGRGGFGIVYKGELQDGTQIAVKRMESNMMGTKGMNEFQAEIGVLTKVRHRHLVALLGFCANGQERLLVYEYMPQGTLGQHLFDYRENGTTPLTWKQRISIALDVARGVEYLHSLAQQSFIHRDLKPTNILLGDDMRAKVADFGLVKNAPDGKYSVETRLAGTFGYLAPEYAATGRVTRKVDVYAYGVVLMELITGRKALDDSMPDENAHLVTWFRRVLINKDSVRKAIDSTLDPDDETFGSIYAVAELAGHCTARDPNQRPDMGHAVNILAPFVEQWKPSRHEEEEAYGIDLHMSLPRALERWQLNEGTSTTMTGDYNTRTMGPDDSQSSIPSYPFERLP